MTSGEPPEAGPSPFVGLRPYTDAESAIFFGRERERRLVSSNLRASRLTLLYGPSGVGKSSILHAAVVPHLRAIAADQAVEGEPPALVVVVFNAWRDEPVAGLIECVAAADPAASGHEREVPDTTQPLPAALRRWAGGRPTDLLVILDQFEEYFLYHGGQGEDRFATEFPDAVNDAGLRVNFLLSFREDALAQLDRFKGRIPKLFGNYLRVGYLDAEGARRAIRGPVERYNRDHPDRAVEVEGALVDKVLDQVEAGKVVVGQAGAGSVQPTAAPAVGERGAPAAIETSHLQIVMARLWREEVSGGSRTLRAATLDRLGGADEIVRGHLARELDSLPEHGQEVAAAAFEHLVTPSGTKIAHSTPDLAILAGVSETDLRDVVGRLSAGSSRILRPVEPAPGRPDERYEIFHDVLAPAILDWRSRFVQQEELRRQRQKADEQARAIRRRARNISAVSLLAALVVVVSALFWNAQRDRDQARSRQQAAEALSLLSVDPTRSIRGALEALDTIHTPEAESALRQAVAGSLVRSVLTGHRDWVNTVAFDSSGTRLVTTSQDGSARTWDVASGSELAVVEGHDHWVATGVFEGAGGLVLSASADGTARLSDSATGQERRAFVPENHDAHALVTAAFDPSQTRVVTAGNDGVVRLWDTASGGELRQLRGHDGLVTTAFFDATGVRVVTAGLDGTARVWDAGTGQELARLEAHEGRVARAVFSPDGNTVATAGHDRHAHLWRWQTGETVVLAGHTEKLASVAFDAAGEKVVTAGDNSARVWDTKDGRLLAHLRGHSGAMTEAVFSGDGRRVATASQDGSARVWDLATETALVELHGHPEVVWDVAFSPTDDRVLATAGSDGTARIWELPEQLTLSHPGRVTGAELSRDGRLVVTAADDGTARIWDAATGRLEVSLPGHQAPMAATFSPDGRLVATVDDAGARIWEREGGGRVVAETKEVRRGRARFAPAGDVVFLVDEAGAALRWEWRTGTALQQVTGYRGTLTVTDIDVSADGRRLLLASSDRVARIWDAATGREELTLSGHRGVVHSARFSPDGRSVVTSSADGTSRTWDAATGEETRAFAAERGLRAAGFDSRTERIVAGGLDGSVWIWDVASGRTLSVLRRHTNTVSSVSFSPEGRILTAGDDWTAAIFDCPTCDGLAVVRALAERRLRGAGDAATAAEVNGWALKPGDCYDPVGAYAVLVECRSPHESEAFAVLEHPARFGEPFDESVIDYARQQCAGQPFEDYVGVPLTKSSYEVSAWTPNRGSWQSGDRRIVCVLSAAEKLTGAARRTGR